MLIILINILIMLNGINILNEEIQGWVGFRHIMDHIAKSNKPVVGHNCFLDLMFLTQSFASDLQNKKFGEFKKIVLESFPSIFDTKYFISCLVPSMKETGLGTITFISSFLFLILLQ